MFNNRSSTPDSKDLGANMGPTWGLSAPDGPHVGPMNLAIRCPPKQYVTSIQAIVTRCCKCTHSNTYSCAVVAVLCCLDGFVISLAKRHMTGRELRCDGCGSLHFSRHVVTLLISIIDAGLWACVAAVPAGRLWRRQNSRPVGCWNNYRTWMLVPK